LETCRSTFGLAVVGFTFAGCGSATPLTVIPEPSPQWPELVPVTDEDPSEGTLAFQLEAGVATKTFPGTPPTSVWAYNGTVPGPLIDAAVGTELVVRFRNRLPEPTTIHWHGVRVPAAMDGTTAVQSPVVPGGTFEYRFVLQDRGLYWFHPHVQSDVQVERGLYGVIHVRGPNEPSADHEGIWVLDDIRVLADGTFPTYLDDNSKMLGRHGNVLLVNGATMPTIPWRAGSVERIQIVNVANGRFFNLGLAGYTWRVIGTDGGFVPNPYDTEYLLIAPGERYDVMLVPNGAPGTEVTLVSAPYDRGHHTDGDPTLSLAKFRITDEPPLTARALPTSFAPIPSLPDGVVDETVVLGEGTHNGQLEFTINGAMHPNVPPISIPLGAVKRFDVVNDTEMDHPFHIHGVFFQNLATNGQPTPPTALVAKDTIISPKMSTLKLVALFDEPGAWMYHCHILEHAEGGMMGEIHVR
jgi:FtsP/CotA-like multicopper oxidase with cupredoxin domain